MNELRLAIKLEGHEAQGKDMFADMEGFSIVKEGEEGMSEVPVYGAPPPAKPVPQVGETSEAEGGVPFGLPESTTGLAMESTTSVVVHQAGVAKPRGT